MTYNGSPLGGTFYVRARDPAAGNVDPTPAWFSWSVDTAPPDTLDSMPFDDQSRTVANFTFCLGQPVAPSVPASMVVLSHQPARRIHVRGWQPYLPGAIDRA